MKLKNKRFLSQWAIFLACVFPTISSQAALFEDEGARKAILDLRKKVDTNSQQQTEELKRANEEISQLRRSLLELQSQIEMLRDDQALLRGQNEQMLREASELQRKQKDITQGVNERLRQFEPVKIDLDGQTFTVDPNEKKDFEAALAQFRKGAFPAAQTAFADFIKRNPESGYNSSALFWLGSAQYATKNYKEAIANFKLLLAMHSEHARAPEAALSIANCQFELKDLKASKKTLEDLIKVYPKSEAAVAARERLNQMK